MYAIGSIDTNDELEDLVEPLDNDLIITDHSYNCMASHFGKQYSGRSCDYLYDPAAVFTSLATHA